MNESETRQVADDLAAYLAEACVAASAPRGEPDPPEDGREGWFASGGGPREPWTLMSEVTVIPLGGFVVLGFAWRRNDETDRAHLLLPIDLREVRAHPRGVANSIIEALDLRLVGLVAGSATESSRQGPRLLDRLPLSSGA